MEKLKKIPIRQCMGCNEHKPKKEMIRIVRDSEGNISLDFYGKKSGRGAYLCPNISCYRIARKSGRISHILECPIPAEIYDALEKEILQNTNTENG